MSKKTIVSLALLIVLLCVQISFAADLFDVEKLYGPRIEKLCMVIVMNADSQVLAAEAGELDIVSDVTRPSDIDRLSRDPNLEMSLARGFHAFFMIMNNKAAPWNDARVRQAAAMSIDRNSIVRMIYSGYCEPVNSWLPPVSPWALPDTGKNHYDRDAAKEKLREAGYSWNLAGMLVAPDGKPLEKIRLYTPLAKVAPTTAELAERIADSLRATGFPVDVEPVDFATLISRMNRKEYSLGVIAWSMGRNPDSLYSFYHSAMDVDSGYNVTGVQDPALDEALYALRFAKDREEAEAASQRAQELLADVVPSVPVYSRFSISVVSKKWKNVLTTPRMTANNMWTLLAAEPTDGKMRTFNMLLAEEPRNLNPLVASSAYAWQVLGMIYETMVGTDPWTLEDRPALAKSWNVRTVESGGAAHTELDFYLRDDILWNDGKKFTAHDVKATLEFIKENEIPRFYDSTKDIAQVAVHSDYALTVKMTGISYWQLDKIGGMICLPKHVLDKVSDWQTWDPVAGGGVSGPQGLVGTGPFMFEEYRPGEYVMMHRNPHYRLLKNKKEP
ncbi:ABC transporter substrate-binding protein, partial [Synergistaceae bacterium OttesenSCG-928-D05]|nr:ABC transporter substrate-binding protein [Synergistaceae bacterium OttesenSCG-928-D05]